MTRIFRVGLLLALLCAMFANSASAQVLYGSIVGTVNDPSGAAVPAATVTATNKQTGIQRQTVSNGAGGYTFVAVQPGSYEVKITKEGFRAGSDAGAHDFGHVEVALGAGGMGEREIDGGEPGIGRWLGAGDED